MMGYQAGRGRGNMKDGDFGLITLGLTYTIAVLALAYGIYTTEWAIWLKVLAWCGCVAAIVIPTTS